MRNPVRSFLLLLSLFHSVNAFADIITIDGVVKSVDVEKRTITIESGAKERTLDVSSKAKITLDGKNSSLSELKKGTAATLSVHDGLDVVVKVIANDSKHDDATAKTMKSLQGHWKCVGGEENGDPQPKSLVKHQNRRLEIKGNSLTMTRVVGDKSGTYVGRFEIDAANGHFDWIGKNPGDTAVEWIGIYELDGEKLKLCYIYQKDGKAPRPKSFKSAPPIERGMPHVSHIYERDND